MKAFMLVFVCLIKCVFDRFASFKSAPFWQIASVLSCAAVFVFDIIKGGYSAFEIIFAGTVPYVIAELLYHISKQARKDKSIMHQLTKTPFSTVYAFFVLQTAMILIASYKIFGV